MSTDHSWLTGSLRLGNLDIEGRFICVDYQWRRFTVRIFLWNHCMIRLLTLGLDYDLVFAGNQAVAVFVTCYTGKPTLLIDIGFGHTWDSTFDRSNVLSDEKEFESGR